MKTKTLFIVALSVLGLVGAAIGYLKFSNLWIGADELLPSQEPNCRVDISGNINLTFLEIKSDLKLLITDQGAVLAESPIVAGKYHFVVENIKPAGDWEIVVRDRADGRNLQYPLSSVSGLKCDSNNKINLEL